MIDEDRSYFGGGTVFERVLVRGTGARGTLTCANVFECGDEVACIGGTFPVFSRKYAADMDGMGVEAHRRVDVQLEGHAHDMRAEPGSPSYRSFDAVGCCRGGIAKHRKQNVSDRHRGAPNGEARAALRDAPISFRARESIQVRKDRMHILVGKVDLRHFLVLGDLAFGEFCLQLSRIKPSVDVAHRARPQRAVPPGACRKYSGLKERPGSRREQCNRVPSIRDRAGRRSSTPGTARRPSMSCGPSPADRASWRRRPKSWRRWRGRSGSSEIGTGAETTGMEWRAPNNAFYGGANAGQQPIRAGARGRSAGCRGPLQCRRSQS